MDTDRRSASASELTRQAMKIRQRKRIRAATSARSEAERRPNKKTRAVLDFSELPSEERSALAQEAGRIRDLRRRRLVEHIEARQKAAAEAKAEEEAYYDTKKASCMLREAAEELRAATANSEVSHDDQPCEDGEYDDEVDSSAPLGPSVVTEDVSDERAFAVTHRLVFIKSFGTQGDNLRCILELAKFYEQEATSIRDHFMPASPEDITAEVTDRVAFMRIGKQPPEEARARRSPLASAIAACLIYALSCTDDVRACERSVDCAFPEDGQAWLLREAAFLGAVGARGHRSVVHRRDLAASVIGAAHALAHCWLVRSGGDAQSPVHAKAARDTRDSLRRALAKESGMRAEGTTSEGPLFECI